MGNATQANPSDYEHLLEGLLIDKEQVLHAFKTFRDLVIFTNERLILIDVQGLTGKKKSFKSVLYSKISVFEKQSAGSLDINSELFLYVNGYGAISLKFGKGSNIDVVYGLISNYVLKVDPSE